MDRGLLRQLREQMGLLGEVQSRQSNGVGILSNTTGLTNGLSFTLLP